MDATTDNNDAPPTLVRCAPLGAAADDAALVRGVEVTLSEEVCHEAYVSGGFCFGPTPQPRPDHSWYATFVVGPPPGFSPLPFTWPVDLRSYRDRSGLAVAAAPSCSIAFPAWRKPWGADPLKDGAVPLQGAVALVGRFSVFDRAQDEADLLRVAPAGAATPGAVERLVSSAPAALQVQGPVLNGTPSAAVLQLRSRDYRAVWIERDAGGTERIRTFTSGRGVADEVAAVGRARGPVALAMPAAGAVAWIETGATGARELHAAFPGATEVLPPAHADPASDASQATVDVGGFFTLRASFLETRAGGVPQLRLRELPFGAAAWTARGDALNRDPGQAASEPALGSDIDTGDQLVIAWVEGGQVLARRIDPGSVGPAQALNAGPANPAGAPLVLGGRVVFVERIAGADVFEVRAWDDMARAWVALPSLPAGGDVATWSGQEFPLAILWQDAVGAWRLRLYNE